jgi:hypothetical protein
MVHLVHLLHVRAMRTRFEDHYQRLRVLREAVIWSAKLWNVPAIDVQIDMRGARDFLPTIGLLVIGVISEIMWVEAEKRNI